ncbi:MAG TPA: hypothetical protein VM123_10990 [archaeon]|nr:hypothetical protein [archaeon]
MRRSEKRTGPSLSRISKSAAAVLGLALLLVPASVLQATVVVYLPLERQCSDAQIIVLALAEDQVSSWDDSKRNIYTDTRFSVEKALKGSAAGTVTVRQLGGRVGDLAESVPGTPSFTVGSQYVLFLETRPDGKYRVVGFSQGCYPVVKGPDGKSRIMPQMASSSNLHIVGGEKESTVGVLSLEEFLARVRGHLGKNAE